MNPLRCAVPPQAAVLLNGLARSVVPGVPSPSFALSGALACPALHTFSLLAIGYLLPLMLLGANEETSRCQFLETWSSGTTWWHERERFSALAPPFALTLQLGCLLLWALLAVPLTWQLVELAVVAAHQLGAPALVQCAA